MTYCIVLVTVPDLVIGKKIALSLLEAKLAACVNQIPGLQSSYIWEGKIEHASEVLLIIKTAKTKVAALVKAVKAEHPSQTPEVISLPIKDGSRDYLKWLGQSLGLEKTKSTSKSKKNRARKQSAKDRKKNLRAQKKAARE